MALNEGFSLNEKSEPEKYCRFTLTQKLNQTIIQNYFLPKAFVYLDSTSFQLTTFQKF